MIERVFLVEAAHFGSAVLSVSRSLGLSVWTSQFQAFERLSFVTIPIYCYWKRITVMRILVKVTAISVDKKKSLLYAWC